jgi:ABC-type transporter Mla MlaB component
VSGRLAAESSAELERVVAEIPGDVRLDVGELRSADAAGLALLRRLQSRGVRLERISPYIKLVLDAAGT